MPEFAKCGVPSAARARSAPVLDVNHLDALAREFVDYCSVGRADVGGGVIHHYQYVGQGGSDPAMDASARLARRPGRLYVATTAATEGMEVL